MGIAVAPITYAQASGDNDKAEVMALNQRFIASLNKKDTSAMMACYSDDRDAIFFDEVPFQFNEAELIKGQTSIP